MKHSPLDQFKIKEIANIQLFGHDVVLTNSAFFMILASFFIILKSVIDAVDGELARMKKTPSYSGRYLDSILILS